MGCGQIRKASATTSLLRCVPRSSAPRASATRPRCATSKNCVRCIMSLPLTSPSLQGAAARLGSRARPGGRLPPAAGQQRPAPELEPAAMHVTLQLISLRSENVRTSNCHTALPLQGRSAAGARSTAAEHEAFGGSRMSRARLELARVYGRLLRFEAPRRCGSVYAWPFERFAT